MAATVWVFAAIAAVLTFAIAAGTIGREAHRLDAVAPRAVYQIDEAVAFVSDQLPPDSQARLTPAEVEALLVAHLRWLHEKGLQPDNAEDARQEITDVRQAEERQADVGAPRAWRLQEEQRGAQQRETDPGVRRDAVPLQRSGEQQLIEADIPAERVSRHRHDSDHEDDDGRCAIRGGRPPAGRAPLLEP